MRHRGRASTVAPARPCEALRGVVPTDRMASGSPPKAPPPPLMLLPPLSGASLRLALLVLPPSMPSRSMVEKAEKEGLNEMGAADLLSAF